jgi:hypothetical protein
MKGQRVIAKVHGEKYVFARVWATFPWAVELTADPHYRKLLSGAAAPKPVPFPPGDVYVADPIPSEEIASGREPDPAFLRNFEAPLSRRLR